MVGCGFGEGIEPALQGLVTFVTDSGQNARVFTTVAVCDTIAELTGGPVTARLMEIGRRPGHPSDGICFLASSVTSFISDANDDHIMTESVTDIVRSTRYVSMHDHHQR